MHRELIIGYFQAVAKGWMYIGWETEEVQRGGARRTGVSPGD
jgi:hypothetical protein